MAETVRYCSLDQCYKSLLSPATSETKRKMSTFISNIKASDGATHHAAGFQKAFQLLRNTTSIGRQGISKSCRKICQFSLRLVLPPLCSTLSLYVVFLLFFLISHRHGHHLPVVRHHVQRVVGAGEEGNAQCHQGGEPTPQQLRHDPHLRPHARYVVQDA